MRRGQLRLGPGNRQAPPSGVLRKALRAGRVERRPYGPRVRRGAGWPSLRSGSWGQTPDRPSEGLTAGERCVWRSCGERLESVPMIHALETEYFGSKKKMALSPSVVPQESEENNANCVETKQSQTASTASEDPLQHLCLASQEVLHKAQQSGRSRCLQCGGSRMFYCYTCYVPVENVPTEQIPFVQLPLKIDIIKHPNETDGKSTAVHAKLLAPDSVNIYTYPCIPEYEGQDHEVVLVFPGPQSISIKDVSFHLQKRIESKSGDKADDLDMPPRKLVRTEAQEGWHLNESMGKGPELKRVVFIDSTWSQTNQITSDERLRELLQVELKTRKTCFWRHQKGKPDTFLSTIEAIYYFLVDYHRAVQKEEYRGQYDNLLFFYSFMYRLIKEARRSGEKAKQKPIH